MDGHILGLILLFVGVPAVLVLAIYLPVALRSDAAAPHHIPPPHPPRNRRHK